MKLATYHKEAIVRSIMNDLPNQDQSLVAKKLQEAIYRDMSPECKRLYNKNPKALRSVQVYDVFSDYSRQMVVGDADVDTVKSPFMQAAAERKALYGKVKAAVNACSTRKQFIDRYPEFSKYAPGEHGTCSTLPAVANLVSELVKHGWKQTVAKG